MEKKIKNIFNYIYTIYVILYTIGALVFINNLYSLLLSNTYSNYSKLSNLLIMTISICFNIFIIYFFKKLIEILEKKLKENGLY